MKIIAPLMIALGIASCGQSTSPQSATKERWNPANDPLRLSGQYQRRLASLPTSGALSKIPWSDHYWPDSTAGIAYRWRATWYDNFSYPVFNQATVRALSLADLSRLSPAEKYDIYVGRYDFPLVQRERTRTKPTNPSWYGLCHGWAAASMNYDEPHSVLVTNPDGIQVPFGASDIKALLTYYQGNIAKAPVRTLGTRCNLTLTSFPTAGLSPECRDTNAGSFHVVLANQIGLIGQPFIAELSRDLEIWNHPVHRFSTQILGYQQPSSGAAPGTVREAVVQTYIQYSNEVSPQWYSLSGTYGHSDAARNYYYRLELDANGEIIGGEWTSYDRPDFLWIQQRPAFTGYFAQLEQLYAAARSGNQLADPAQWGWGE